MKQIERLTIGIILILGIGATFYISTLEYVSINKTIYTMTWEYKISLISICLILVFVFIGFIYLLKRRINEEQSHIFSTWVMSVVMVELICTLCLTPLWLDMMYGIPYVVSLCIRIIKECVVLPIEIFIGYTLIQLLNRVLKI